MAGLTSNRIHSATLVETLVAMVIMLSIFAITAAIFVQVTGESISIQKIKALELASAYAEQTKQVTDITDEETRFKDLIGKRTVTFYNEEQGVLLVNIAIFNNSGVQLAQKQFLINR